MDVLIFRPGALVRQASMWVMVGTIALYLILVLASDIGHLGEGVVMAFGFELLAWGLSIAIVIESQSAFQVRISDPAVLMVLWATIYLVLPSIIWFVGQPVPWSQFLDAGTMIELLLLHGVFIFCLVVSYLITRPAPCAGCTQAAVHGKTGWILLLLPALPLVLETARRVAGGGSLLPHETYGEWWFSLQANVQASRESGGFDYFWTQIANKAEYYPLLIQGIGCGLVMAAALETRRGRVWRLLALGGVIAFMLLFGTGRRTDVIIVCLAGVILCDFVGRPLRWRHLVPLLVAGLVLLDFMTAYRSNRNLPAQEAVSTSFVQYASPEYARLNEFTTMLGKEAVVVQLVKKDRSYLGAKYLVNQLLQIVPSQLVPEKQSPESTGDLVSRLLLGRDYLAGAGSAGAAVGDGYRMAGPAGVALVAALIGLGIAGVERLLRGRARTDRRPSLLRLCLWSGILAWTFLIIRSEPGNLLVVVVYSCLIPLVVLEYLLSWIPGAEEWITPLEERIVSESS